jgi:gliding motility-associated lipoprotein GldH
MGTGCGDDFIYKQELEIPNQSWAYDDTLKFDFTIEDTTKIYSLLLDVHHSAEYGFQNLYVQFHTHFPSGKTEKQVVSLELAKQSGVWNGDCGGNSCTVEIPLQEKALFQETGRYTLAIEQYMRQSPLPGVKSMELKIKRVGMR